MQHTKVYLQNHTEPFLTQECMQPCYILGQFCDQNFCAFFFTFFYQSCFSLLLNAEN